jgi:hypothetical protein
VHFLLRLLSRSALADRFIRLIGFPPMHYLDSWKQSADSDTERGQRAGDGPPRGEPEIKLLDKDVWQPAMTVYSQVLLSIAISLSTVTPLIAAEITYSDYAKAPDAWKRGFVFGISQYLSAVAQPDEEPPFPVRSAYQRCLAGPTDAILARHLEGYVARNPPSPKEPMIRVALRAMFDFCRSEIEKTQPSQVRPAR